MLTQPRRHLVFGLDLTTSSAKALEWVYQHLAQDGDHLTLVTIPDSTSILHDIQADEEYQEALKKVEELKSRLAQYDKVVHVHIEIEQGDPRDLLLKYVGVMSI